MEGSGIPAMLSNKNVWLAVMAVLIVAFIVFYAYPKYVEYVGEGFSQPSSYLYRDVVGGVYGGGEQKSMAEREAEREGALQKESFHPNSETPSFWGEGKYHLGASAAGGVVKTSHMENMTDRFDERKAIANVY